MIVEEQNFYHGMQVLNRQQSEDKITQYAREGRPFLFVINFQGTSAYVMTPEEARENRFIFNINGITNYPPKETRLRTFSFRGMPVSLPVYRRAFEKVIAALNHGDTYLLNLTFPTKLETDLTPEEIFFFSCEKYKLMAGDAFVVFSPESFIRILDQKIFSFPMKGTISALIPGAEEIILADRKELYEHNTIVDLIRNDLGMVATHVKVERFRYVERIKSRAGDLLQVSSEISGELPADFLSNLGTLLFTLLPAGSVTGAPKKRTVELILETENYERGFYTGIMGYFDGKSLDSAVMIRFIEFTPGGPVYKSGGGITALSDLKSEYEEMIRKVYVPVV
jgi:para-aminobenzoate synthetase component 1